ncbi:MAG: DUF4382 domain-containing protein [Pseudomonadota bacterium]
MFNLSGKRINELDWRRMAIPLLAMTLIGCGGSSGPSEVAMPDLSEEVGEEPESETGTLMISLTDAEGDFVAYTVDVDALRLNRANGDVVETLPLSTRVDFTELTEVTEFLSIVTVPAGQYDSVSLDLDFTDAEILVQDDMGNAIVADVEDGTGAALGEVTVRLNLSTSDVIRIAPGIPAAFSLDFDLDASNDIDLTATPPVVTVEPFLLATPELETDREHRVRGILTEVDADGESFDLHVRPFRHRTGQFGELTIFANDDTQYEIDGEGYTGSAGLQAMAGLDEDAPVIAHGMIEAEGMMAGIVVAGSSVPWSDGDVIRGVVSARVDDTLMIRGAVRELASGARAFHGEFSVQVGDLTAVSAPGVDNALLSDSSISVGQNIVAWGEFVDDQTLDATEGRVRMQMNQLTAEVSTVVPLTVDLLHLNSRRPAIFDFTGTGITSDQDADPDAYEIDAGALSLSTVDEGDLVKVRGLVNEFGLAPADFNARTVIDVDLSHRSANLAVGWNEGTTQPFTDLSTGSATIDLSEARFALRIRGVHRGLLEDVETITLLPPESGAGVYATSVRGSGEVSVYDDFGTLVDALMRHLDDGQSLHRINVTGQYNLADNNLSAARAGFVFSDAES